MVQEKDQDSLELTDKLRRVDVDALLRGSREICLVYNGTEYRLRLTSNDRLILTK
ncbi:MAG: hemin uptake protein HemP [Alphaproteobacteria bacterium]|uniref:hemin uptake protein HemP n=1 Tax=Nisaea sp. TaxID=2024842 RepID=UPI003263E253